MASTPTKYTADQINIFAAVFAETLDATKAYMAAYPKSKKTSAKTSGSRFLDREEVKTAVRTLMNQKVEQANVGVERVLSELEAMAFVKLDDYADFMEETEPERDPTTGVVTRVPTGRMIPVLSMEKIRDNPVITKALTGRFKRIIDKDGGTHDVYELDMHNKQAALFKLMDYHLTMAGKLAPAGNRTVMQFNVNFPIPGSGWRNKSAPHEPIDLEPIDQ